MEEVFNYNMSLINEGLEDGEELLWVGNSSSDKIMDNTYRIPYALKFILSYGIAAALMVYALNKTGEIKVPVILMLLTIGSMLPLTAIADGLKVRKLSYAATDRRLIKVNGSLLCSAPYEDIGSCEFKTDASGNTSLLCGKKSVKAKPSKWRDLALFSGELEKDADSQIVNYVLYAINDPGGLKKAIEDKVDCKTS